MRIATLARAARSGRMELGVEDRGQGWRVVMNPFEPSGGLHFLWHACIEKDDARMRSPRTSQIDLLGAGFRCDAAMVKDVAALLAVIALALRRQHDGLVRQRVNLAIFKECKRV